MAHEPYFSVKDQADTAILMIHGILGTPDHFKPLLPLVPAEWSVYNILLDGHGKNASDFSNSSMAKWKTQVSELIDQLSNHYDRILIAAHSMGTLFAIQEAIKHPQKIKGLFLLGSCLRATLKPLAVQNALKVSLGWIRKTDEAAMAAADACSIMPTKKLWNYLGWLPRYWELLREIRLTRALLPQLSVPSLVCQSAHDEMVSQKAAGYFQNLPQVEQVILNHSTHFHYKNGDLQRLQVLFEEFCANYKTEMPQ